MLPLVAIEDCADQREGLREAQDTPRSDRCPRRDLFALRAVAAAVEDAEIGTPGAYGLAILVGQDARDLVQVGEVVGWPRWQEAARA